MQRVGISIPAGHAVQNKAYELFYYIIFFSLKSYYLSEGSGSDARVRVRAGDASLSDSKLNSKSDHLTFYFEKRNYAHVTLATAFQNSSYVLARPKIVYDGFKTLTACRLPVT